MVLLPFVGHNLHGWIRFCTDSNASTHPPPWCYRRIPLIYNYVQEKYWNVGFLRYWEIAQIPNFLIALPIIALLSWSCTIYLWHQSQLILHKEGPSITDTALRSKAFLNTDLLPHSIHALTLTSWITFAAHVQILLRLAPSMPYLYWSAARLLIEHPRFGKYWVYWSVIWAPISTVLWATFLPPA